MTVSGRGAAVGGNHYGTKGSLTQRGQRSYAHAIGSVRNSRKKDNRESVIDVSQLPGKTDASFTVCPHVNVSMMMSLLPLYTDGRVYLDIICVGGARRILFFHPIDLYYSIQLYFISLSRIR